MRKHTGLRVLYLAFLSTPHSVDEHNSNSVWTCLVGELPKSSQSELGAIYIQIVSILQNNGLARMKYFSYLVSILIT